jgi:cytoskeleton protein RodZ
MAVLFIVLVIVIALIKSGNPVDSPYAPAALPSAPQTEETTPSPSVPVVTAPEPENVVDPTLDGLTAQLVFAQDCWMEIRIDEQLPFQELFRAGATKELKGTNKIEFVRIGNAAGLSVTLNGKKLSSFQDGGKVVNNIVVTHDTIEMQ